jgi:transposase
MKVIKQSIGIDVSKDQLEVVFKEKTPKRTRIKGSTKFDNNDTGFKKMLYWCDKREVGDNIVYTLEATGVYHEDILYYLYDAGKKVSVELPQRIKYFAKSLGIETKNDKIDGGVIADYGMERNLRLWKAPSKNFREIRTLSREHTALKGLKTQAHNRLHAIKHSHAKNPMSIDRYEKQIEFYEEQLSEIEKEISGLVKSDTKLKEKIDRIITIKGVGLISVVKVLSETDGFFLFKSIKQLVSYSGLDIIEKQSGNYSGKTKISKKGNSRIRTALYMPAMTAIQHNDKLRAFNDRIMETHVYKKQGIVAVMRKLLILIYTLWKKNEVYNPDYQWGTC